MGVETIPKNCPTRSNVTIINNIVRKAIHDCDIPISICTIINLYTSIQIWLCALTGRIIMAWSCTIMHPFVVYKDVTIRKLYTCIDFYIFEFIQVLKFVI